MHHIIFITPYFTENAKQFIRALVLIDPLIKLSIISQDMEENLSHSLKNRISKFRRLTDIFNLEDMVCAAQKLAENNGPIHRCLVANEQVQETVASLRDRMDITGMRADTAKNYRDKIQMKKLLKQAGIPCADFKLVNSSLTAQQSIDELGFPVVVKPPKGAASQGISTIKDQKAWDHLWSLHPPHEEEPWLVEQMLFGKEHSCDTFFLNGRALFRTFTDYIPSPINVLENEWIQWQVILPKVADNNRYVKINKIADRTINTLGPENGWSHLEWFEQDDGQVAVSEIAMRPPGAQFTTLISRSADFDSLQAWADLMIYEKFSIPFQKYAVGAAYLRGEGLGKVTGVQGLDAIFNQYSDLITDYKLPEIGQSKAQTYEGEGYIIIRDTENDVVKGVLSEIVSKVKVELG